MTILGLWAIVTAVFVVIGFSLLVVMSLKD